MEEKSKCRKCGTIRNRSFCEWFNGREFKVEWMPEHPVDHEYLKITCPTCGYSWEEEVENHGEEE